MRSRPAGRGLRIRWRLAALGTVLATGTIGLFAVLLVALAAASTPKDQDKALDALAAQAATVFQDGAATPGRAPARTVDPVTSSDRFVLVADADGRIVYSEATLPRPAPQLPAALLLDAQRSGQSRATTVLGGVELRLSARPLAAGTSSGTGAGSTSGSAAGSATSATSAGVVVAAQSATYVATQLAGLRAVLVIAAILTAVAGAVASWVVSGRALRPLGALAATAGDVARTGDLSRRLAVPAVRDEVAALATQFNAMMDRVEAGQAGLTAALEEQRRFVADASHELRTPLSTVRAGAGFLADRPDADPADRRDAVADVLAEANRMTGLVDDLLMLARTDALPVAQRRPVDLRVLVGDVCRLVHRGATLQAAQGREPVVVLGDETLLRRAVRGLLDNAVVHGGAAVEAHVCRDEAGQAVVVVRDHGPGVPESALPHVFERFYRADPVRSGPGSGLGLSIVRSVAGLHGGTVTLENAPGGGALATLRLPTA